MSSVDADEVNEGDLIDLHVGSPDFPVTPLEVASLDDDCDNLIDSELQVLEEKLKVLPQEDLEPCKYTVSTEDILISLNDDDDEVELEVKTDDEESNCWEHAEALNILVNLDMVLNASLMEDEPPEEITEESIKECLHDLDDYLKEFDVSESEESQTDDASNEPKPTPNDSRSQTPETTSHKPTPKLNSATIAAFIRSRPLLTKQFLYRSFRDLPYRQPANKNHTPWLRTSMRRLRHIRLPNDDAVTTPTAVTPTPTTPAPVIPTTLMATAVSPGERPVSAPSVMAGRSRSRSRGGEEAARARSSSASSRSRRPRSLSSSVTSLASSVDSTPSFGAAAAGAGVESGGGNVRRDIELRALEIERRAEKARLKKLQDEEMDRLLDEQENLAAHEYNCVDNREDEVEE